MPAPRGAIGVAGVPIGDARYPVELTTSDGVRLRIDVPDGATVVEAAAQTGLILPSQCGQGTCGTCHATARGAYRLGAHSPSALPADQAAAGGVLLCRTYPVGAVDVTLSYARSRIIDGGIAERGASILSVTRVAHDTVVLTLQLDPDEVTGTGVEFEPGQFMELQLPGDDRRRAYSLTNTANWDGEVEFLIRLHEGGYFSTFLVQRAAPGERLIVHGPMGAFGLRESGLRPRWFVAGGTGLAPMLSMVRRMAEWGEPHPARLILGVNEETDVPRLDQLAEVRAALPDFIQQICVWHAGDTWTGTCGTPVDALAEALKDERQVPDVYVCGPPKLVDAVLQVARDAGLPAEHVITERILPT
jgi:ferredoxin-NADP reductase/ferredoxin